MMKPLVSILMPAYNAQDYIGDALRSALSQTWARKEIIVVDDGSTDDTLKIAQQFASGSVQVITQKNQGASASRNKAFSLSQGDYIQYLDADDLMSPDKIAKQMEAADRYDSKRTLFTCAWGKFFHRHHRAQFRPSALWNDLSPAEWLLRKMGQNLCMMTTNFLVSRQLVQAAGPWDTRILGDDDGEFFCRILINSDGARFVPDAKVYYRSSGSSAHSYIGQSNRKLEAQWTSMKLHIGYLRSLEDSERTRAACVTYLQNWMAFFYPERFDIFQEAGKLAVSLGGELIVPPLSWKYSWIETIFGRALAKRAQINLPNLKWSLVRSWDKALLRLEDRKFAGN
jgi:glycosyltransferase involved in cell wall biosynthesis